MLNLFRPRCPVEFDAKDWIETRFSWLTNEFGIQRLVDGTTVLPTEEFFPLEYDCSENGIQLLMERVAAYMDVDASRLILNFYEDDSPQFMDVINGRTAGLYSENQGYFDIWLEVNGLDDAAGVLATLAHEIGHVLLLGERRISPDERDHEELTDLLTVFMGLGIFSANSVVRETSWTSGGWSGWSVGKRGYLSMHMFGYALALYALARGHPRPEWARHLRPDAKAYLHRGIRYITKTSDCKFKPAFASTKKPWTSVNWPQCLPPLRVSMHSLWNDVKSETLGSSSHWQAERSSRFLDRYEGSHRYRIRPGLGNVV